MRSASPGREEQQTDMTISGYSNAIVDLMLGWLKGLANWVLRLFNLAGNVGGSPLLWLSHNWLKLLIFFLALGIILDSLIWLIRWRHYWVWFRKERVIVNDDRFFINADIDKASDWEGDLASNWDEHDYVVASTVVRRRQGDKPASSASGEDRKRSRTTSAGRKAARRRSEATRVQRHDAKQGDSARQSKAEGGARRDTAHRRGTRTQERSTGRPDNIFATELKRRDVSDSYEDEVFNVSNLPTFEENEAADRERRRSKGGRKRR